MKAWKILAYFEADTKSARKLQDKIAKNKNIDFTLLTPLDKKILKAMRKAKKNHE